MDPKSRIVVDPDVCSGKPTIRGTRVMVHNILGMIGGGCDRDRILEEYPDLTEEDIAAAFDYAATVVAQARVDPRS